jgi:hypothetical protein
MDLEEASSRYIAGEMDLDRFRSRAADTPGSQAEDLLMLITRWENTQESESRLRARVADLLATWDQEEER